MLKYALTVEERGSTLMRRNSILISSFVTAVAWVGFLVRELYESLAVSVLLVVGNVGRDPVDNVFLLATGKL